MGSRTGTRFTSVWDIESLLFSCGPEYQNMTTSVRQIVESFEKLTASEQVDVAAEILRRTSGMTFPPLADEDLCEIAAETFRQLDEQEASQ